MSRSTIVRHDVLDLRHFSAAALRNLLSEETDLWQQRLRWDYRASAQLLLDYLDSRILPGFVATEDGRPAGYVFCVYEQHKAVIGDVFATAQAKERAMRIEERLLAHTLELLQSTPGTSRVETQLLLHPKGQFRELFTRSGFSVYPRVFMERALRVERPPRAVEIPPSLRLRHWREGDFAAAGRLIALAYQGHLDSIINDQYRTTAGSMRFLHNIVRFPGCGQFDPATSLVLAYRDSEDLAGVVLCSRVNHDTGHVTQLCVEPALRGTGLGRLLLEQCMKALAAQAMDYISLTVTEGNQDAVQLYRRLGFKSRHAFDAMVWQRE
ncbi:MAG TPA: GNAT family N-acetyltransferase [Steroidobacteraceae bacterium]|nr:GNAT family N-acetyltransferase [Steroidobacteraceae bacterium]